MEGVRQGLQVYMPNMIVRMSQEADTEDAFRNCSKAAERMHQQPEIPSAFIVALCATHAAHFHPRLDNLRSKRQVPGVNLFEIVMDSVSVKAMSQRIRR